LRLIFRAIVTPEEIDGGPFDGRFQTIRLDEILLRNPKAAIAVQFSDYPDHPVDRLEVGRRHGAEGDRQRLVQTADLNGRELLGRPRHAPGKNVPDDRAHALFAASHARRDLGDRNATVEIIDDQLFPLELGQPRGARLG
jgi:hypothetical protein